MLRKVPPFIYHLLIYSFLWLLYFTANRMLNFRLLICMFFILKHSFTRSFSCNSEATNYLLFTRYIRRLQESYCRAIFILDHTHPHITHTKSHTHKIPQNHTHKTHADTLIHGWSWVLFHIKADNLRQKHLNNYTHTYMHTYIHTYIYT